MAIAIKAKAEESIQSVESFGLGTMTLGLAPEPVSLHDWKLETVELHILCPRLCLMEDQGWITELVAPAFGGGLYGPANKIGSALVLYKRHRMQ